MPAKLKEFVDKHWAVLAIGLICLSTLLQLFVSR
jgi:hypothetical protein